MYGGRRSRRAAAAIAEPIADPRGFRVAAVRVTARRASTICGSAMQPRPKKPPPDRKNDKLAPGSDCALHARSRVISNDRSRRLQPERVGAIRSSSRKLRCRVRPRPPWAASAARHRRRLRGSALRRVLRCRCARCGRTWAIRAPRYCCGGRRRAALRKAVSWRPLVPRHDRGRDKLEA